MAIWLSLEFWVPVTGFWVILLFIYFRLGTPFLLFCLPVLLYQLNQRYHLFNSLLTRQLVNSSTTVPKLLVHSHQDQKLLKPPINLAGNKKRPKLRNQLHNCLNNGVLQQCRQNGAWQPAAPPK